MKTSGKPSQDIFVELKCRKMAYWSCRCFLVVFSFYLCFRLSYGVLYSSADHIVLLENDTISSVVHNSPSAWVVEFYSSFCGHCHAFAPTWKKLAKMAKGETVFAKLFAITVWRQLRQRKEHNPWYTKKTEGFHLLGPPLFRCDIFLMKSRRNWWFE